MDWPARLMFHAYLLTFVAPLDRRGAASNPMFRRYPEELAWEYFVATVVQSLFADHFVALQ